MSDTISNVFSEGPSKSTSDMSIRLVHPGPLSPTVGAPVTATTQVNAPDTSTIINFNLDNCEELTDTDMNQYLDVQENKENNKDLSVKDMMQYMQMFEKNVMKGVIRLASERKTLTWSERICARLLDITFLQFKQYI